MSVTHLEEFVQLMVKSSSARLAEAAAKAVDGPNWRETLHRLVARCCRPKDKRSGEDTDSFANALQLANSVVNDFSPVVSLYDVLKYEDPAAAPVPQDQFLQYFGLQLNNNAEQETKRPEHKPHVTYYVRNLITTPQVPFSSDLGIKLIKERPEIPPEIHERKLERLERYLHSSSNCSEVEYEVIYNKNIDLESSHFYTFPTRHFHDKNKLTPKARHLLKKYCRPCSVRLVRMTLTRLNPRKETPAMNSETKVQQKENIQLLKNTGIYLDSRVVLTDNFNPSFKTSNFLSNKSIPKTSDNERTTRQRNFLKTLAPRDENTMDIDKDFVNACVVLQPISVIKLKGQNNKKSKNGRITRATRFYSRRFSPRLHVDSKALLM